MRSAQEAKLSPGVLFAVLVGLYAVVTVTLEPSHLFSSLLAAGAPLSSQKGRSQFDVAIVLGYALEDDGSPTCVLGTRVRRGVELLLQGSVHHVVFSGGHDGAGLRNTSEAKAMLQYALRTTPHHINTSILRPDLRNRWQLLSSSSNDWAVLEEASTSTRTNAELSLQMIHERNWRSAVVVTSRFHQIRSKRTFQVAANQQASITGSPPIEIAAIDISEEYERNQCNPTQQTLRSSTLVDDEKGSPPDDANEKDDDAMGTAQQVMAEIIGQYNLVREVAAIALYWARGWI